MPDIDLSDFAAAGFEVEHADVLTLTGEVRRAPLVSGLTIRVPGSPEDWGQIIDLGTSIAILEEGYNAETHPPYLRQRYRNRQAQVADGQGAWFAAWDGPELVASMGVLVGNGLIRFQDVQTRASYRRQGICAALLAHTCRWAQQQAPGAVPVIIAEEDGDAGRIYRRSGFKLTEKVHSALRPGY